MSDITVKALDDLELYTGAFQKGQPRGARSSLAQRA